MTTTSTREAEIEVDPTVPLVRITREFDFPVEKVFRAHAEPDLFARWMGPRGMDVQVHRFDFATGGGYRYSHADENGEYAFYGSFHEVRPDELIVQTFTFEGRDAFVASGMEVGVQEGYRKLDELLAVAA